MTALREKNPEKERTEDADSENNVFSKQRPLGSIERPNRHGEENREIDVAPRENDGFSEFEIFMHEGIFSAIVRMAHEFAINDKFNNQTDDSVGNHKK